MDRKSTCSMASSPNWLSAAMANTVSATPGSEMDEADASIPSGPAACLPTPAETSTGRAPGVTLAMTISLLNSSSVMKWCLRTSVSSSTGIRAEPPPKPTQPMPSMVFTSWPSVGFFDVPSAISGGLLPHLRGRSGLCRRFGS